MGRWGDYRFVWVTLRNLTISKLRESELKVECSSIGSTEGEVLLSKVQTNRDGPEAIEAKVLLNGVIQCLTPAERKVALLKQAEFTSQEIAQELKTSKGSVDQMYFRAKHKLRKALRPDAEGE